VSEKEGGGILRTLTSRDPAINAAIIATMCALALILLAVLGPIAIVIVTALGIAKAVHWYMTLPEKTSDIAKAVGTVVDTAGFPTALEFFDALYTRYEADCKRSGVTPAGYNVMLLVCECAMKLYEAENFTGRPPLRRVIEGGISDGQYRDDLIDRAKKAADPARTMDVVAKTLSHAFLGFTSSLPAAARDVVDRQDASKAAVVVNLIDMMPDTRQAIEYLIAPFFTQEIVDLGLFKELRAQLERNADTVNDKKFLMPTETDLGPIETIDAYLSYTPLMSLFTARIPWEIPQELRFEHQWIVTPQGGGKTTFIQHQLIQDIQRVANNEASVVVMDSQGDLINLVAGLKAIPPEKLLIIEPDPGFPISLNLFDLGKSRIEDYDDRTRQMLDTNAIDLLTQIFDSLLGTATTAKQTTLFRHAVRLCRAVPGATLKTFSEILSATKVPYPEVVAHMPDATRDFFEGQFTNTTQFKETKQELGWRLSLMLENETFAGMFSQKHSKLDLFTELNSSKVILINTDKGLLKQQGTELFGRFFIAMLLQAAQERALLAKSSRLPTFVYIDEAQDYIAHDANIVTLCDQARKMRVGLSFANQRVAQMDTKVLDTLTNVAIKCARAVNDSGAHTLARNMGTTPDFIQKQPVGSFAIALRNEPAVSIKIPHGKMEAMERRTTDEIARIRAQMREKYAVPYEIPPAKPIVNLDPRSPGVEPVHLQPKDKSDPDDPDNSSTRWPRS
jgi:hypothetical protein